MIQFYPKSEFEINEENGLVTLDVHFKFTMTPYLAEQISEELVRYATNNISLINSYKDANIFRLFGWWLALTSNDKECAIHMARLLLAAVGKAHDRV